MRLVLGKPLAGNIMPELLQCVVEVIVDNQKSNVGVLPRGGAIVWYVIHVGAYRRHCVANRFGVVKVIVSGIRPSNKETVGGMVGTVSKTPLPQLVVARIFVQ